MVEVWLWGGAEWVCTEGGRGAAFRGGLKSSHWFHRSRTASSSLYSTQRWLVAWSLRTLGAQGEVGWCQPSGQIVSWRERGLETPSTEHEKIILPPPLMPYGEGDGNVNGTFLSANCLIIRWCSASREKMENWSREMILVHPWGTFICVFM